MSASIRAVGLDVHASQTTIAILDRASGELRRQRLRVAPTQLVGYLAALEPMRAVYESGPTGLALARAAQERGLDVRVCPPGSVGRRVDRVKTDGRDAERLARLLAAGELRFARVPSLEHERFRDLLRAREDIRCDLMRARHRLSKMLLRRDIRYAGPGRAWCRAHLDWLRALKWDDPASTVTFCDYLAAVEALLQRRRVLDAAIAELAPESPFADTIARLRCFRGIER